MSAPTPPAPSAPKWRQFLSAYPKITAALLALLTAGLSALATRYGVDPRVVEVVTEVIKEVPAADDAPAPSPVKRSYGWTRPAATEVPERTFSAPQAVVDHLPQSLHLVSAPTPEVPAPLPFDQGQLGSCGPNSAAALILYTEAKAGKKGQPPPSRLFVYYTTRLLMGTTSQD
ncbi:MAG: hypothetical protein J0I06_11245, partial [Planctomycetes bacterium]|nr:hypothetical protein [Planctomycetota bacterium]